MIREYSNALTNFLYALCTKHEISLALQRDTPIVTTLVFENYKISLYIRLIFTPTNSIQMDKRSTNFTNIDFYLMRNNHP